ncbi:MAG: V-type ATP synthase subunit E family protein [archaeon]
MGIEEVRKEILAGAKAEAKKLLQEGEKEAKALVDVADSKLKNRQKELTTEATHIIEEYKVRSAAERASAERKEKLAMDKRALEEVFSDAKQKLTSMSIKKREQLLVKMLERSRKKFAFSRIYASKEDAKFLKKFNVVPHDLQGGVILENEDGSVRVDLSYASMLGAVREESLAQITKKLY